MYIPRQQETRLSSPPLWSPVQWTGLKHRRQTVSRNPPALSQPGGQSGGRAAPARRPLQYELHSDGAENHGFGIVKCLLKASQVLQRQDSACPCRRRKRHTLDPWSSKQQPTPVFLPGKFHGKGAWGATVHGVKKSQTRLSAHSAFYRRNAAWKVNSKITQAIQLLWLAVWWL